MILTKLLGKKVGLGNPTYIGDKKSWSSLNTISGIQAGDIALFSNFAVSNAAVPGNGTEKPTDSTIIRSDSDLGLLYGVRFTSSHKILTQSDIDSSNFGSGVTGNIFTVRYVNVYRVTGATTITAYGVTGVIYGSTSAGINLTFSAGLDGPAIGWFFIVGADLNDQGEVDSLVTAGTYTVPYRGNIINGYKLFNSGQSTASQEVNVDTVQVYGLQGGHLNFT